MTLEAPNEKNQRGIELPTTAFTLTGYNVRLKANSFQFLVFQLLTIFRFPTPSGEAGRSRGA